MMAVRIRKNGQIFCAAHSEALDGDCYIDDPLHYVLAVERKVLVTDDNHFTHWQWWWAGQMPIEEKNMDDYINGCTGLVDDHDNAVDVPYGGDARTAKVEPLTDDTTRFLEHLKLWEHMNGREPMHHDMPPEPRTINAKPIPYDGIVFGE